MQVSWAVVAQVFNPRTWKAEAKKDRPEFQDSPVYRMSSRSARATQRNPVSKKKERKKDDKKVLRWAGQGRR